MVLSSLVGSPRTAARRPQGRRRTGLPPTLEALEDRCLLSATLVRDINPGSASSQPAPLVAVGGTVFFLATDPVYGRELYKSDGTEAGTVLVKDITPGADGTRAQLLGAVNGKLVFLVNPAPEPPPGDGGPGTTDFPPAGGPFELPPAYVASLWVSDGTEAGTMSVASLGLVTSYTILGLSNPTELNGSLYFLISRGEADPLGLPTIVSTNSLWRTDGTAAGTKAVASAGEFGEMEAVNGTLFMTAYKQAATGFELYKLNAAENGIELVKDIRPGSLSSFPSRLTNFNGTLFFAPTGGGVGELWRSDGTEEGTYQVKDIRPGPLPSSPLDLTVVGDTLYFTADDGTSGRELWKSDGTEEGTVRVRDIVPGSGTAQPSQLVAVGGTLFFTATDATSGRELWRSDGTEAGTVLVKDVRPGSASSSPGGLTAVGGTLFFTADDGANGRELWASDGTEEGTRLVRDIRPGAAGSNPLELRAVGGRLFFTADDGTNGRELWVVAPAAVAEVTVNDGAAQRSRVTSVTVTFSEAVTLQDGAFELRRQGGELVSLSVATSEVDGRTVAVLTFLGDDVLGGSLADGNYTLTVRGALVRDALGRALDGDGDGAAGGDRTADFFRLYGDADGDGRVDGTDQALFDSTFGLSAGDAGFLGYFDYDGDELIGTADLDAFLSRLGG